MTKISILLANFLFFLITSTHAQDCTQIPPFTLLESVKVEISVDRYFWIIENGLKVQKSEPVCKTSAALEIGTYDIRGRENDWYYCFYQTPRPQFECQTTYNEENSLLIVRPAVVLRSYPSSPGIRDTHAHVFLAPGFDWSRYRDTFIRSLTFNLSKHEIILDSLSGGQGPNSNEDSFGVRLHYK